MNEFIAEIIGTILLILLGNGIDFVKLESLYCGISGSYRFKKENYETAQGVGLPLFDQIECSKVDFIATDCETCKWQIEMSISRKVQHPISSLADALDVEATKKLWKE